jgi:hypothetical protein
VSTTKTAAQIPKAMNRGSCLLKTHIKLTGKRTAADIELKETNRVNSRSARKIATQPNALK